jgi:hypothetical protein
MPQLMDSNLVNDSKNMKLLLHFSNWILDLIPSDLNFGLPSLRDLDGTKIFDDPKNLQLLESAFNEFLSIANIDGLRLNKTHPESIIVSYSNFLGSRTPTVEILIGSIFNYYYTHPEVLKVLTGSQLPPFPSGRSVPQSDFDGLELVYERGEIYKKV